MAALVLSMIILSMAARSSATWCVCKKGGNTNALQSAIDFACGNGADCTQIHQGGKCYNPDTVFDHCNYAVNSYFQRKGQASGTCDFSGAAMVSTTDPSNNGCAYPSSASPTVTTSPTGNTNIPGSTTLTPGGSMGGNNPTTGNNPTNTGVLGGGVGPGLGPSGSGINDVSDGGFRLHQEISIFGFLAMLMCMMI